MSYFILLLLLFAAATRGATADIASQSDSPQRSPSDVFGSSDNPAQRFLDNLTDTDGGSQNKAASSSPSPKVLSFGNRFLQDLFGWDLTSKTPVQDSSESSDTPDFVSDDATPADSALLIHGDSSDDILTIDDMRTDDDLLVDDIERIPHDDPIPIDTPAFVSSISSAPENDMDDAILTKGSNADPAESSQSEADPPAGSPRLVIVLNFDNVDSPGKNVLNMLKRMQKPRRSIGGARAQSTKNNSNITTTNADTDAADKAANDNTDSGSDESSPMQSSSSQGAKSSTKRPAITQDGASDSGNESVESNDAARTGSAIDDKLRITSSNNDNAHHGRATHLNRHHPARSDGTASDGDESSGTPNKHEHALREESSGRGGNGGNAKDNVSGQNSKPMKLLVRAKPAHTSSTGRSEPPTIEVEMTFDGGDGGPAVIAQVLKGMLQ